MRKSDREGWNWHVGCADTQQCGEQFVVGTPAKIEVGAEKEMGDGDTGVVARGDEFGECEVGRQRYQPWVVDKVEVHVARIVGAVFVIVTRAGIEVMALGCVLAKGARGHEDIPLEVLELGPKENHDRPPMKVVGPCVRVTLMLGIKVGDEVELGCGSGR